MDPVIEADPGDAIGGRDDGDVANDPSGKRGVRQVRKGRDPPGRDPATARLLPVRAPLQKRHLHPAAGQKARACGSRGASSDDGNAGTTGCHDS